jgi:hypothetical protein
MATDNEILELLREIRDIQKQHLDAYQKQSDRALSQNAMVLRRQRIALTVIVLILVVAIVYLLLAPSDVSRWEAIQKRTQEQLDQSERQQRQWNLRNPQQSADNEN